MERLVADFIFNSIDHSYHLDGERLFSVTEILADNQMIDVRWFTEIGRQRGSLVHKVVEYDLANDLDEDSLEEVGKEWIDPKTGATINLFEPSELKGYLQSARATIRLLEFKPVNIEVPAYHPLYRYAGTADTDGMIRDRAAILDWKLGQNIAGEPIQTSMYANLKANPSAWVRLKIRLRNDGKPGQVTEHPLRDLMRDFQLGLSALALSQWRREKKVNGGNDANHTG